MISFTRKYSNAHRSCMPYGIQLPTTQITKILDDACHFFYSKPLAPAMLDRNASVRKLDILAHAQSVIHEKSIRGRHAITSQKFFDTTAFIAHSAAHSHLPILWIHEVLQTACGIQGLHYDIVVVAGADIQSHSCSMQTGEHSLNFLQSESSSKLIDPEVGIPR